MSVNPYGRVAIHETCQCGATFDWNGDTWLGKCAAEKFRRDHAACREDRGGSNQDKDPKP